MVVGDASAEGREVLHLNDGEGGHIFFHRVWPFHEYHCVVLLNRYDSREGGRQPSLLLLWPFLHFLLQEFWCGVDISHHYSLWPLCSCMWMAVTAFPPTSRLFDLPIPNE